MPENDTSRPVRPPPSAQPVDWVDVRRRYVETDASVADICAATDLDRAELDRVRKRERWRRLHPRPFPATAPKPPVKPPSSTKRSKPKPASKVPDPPAQIAAPKRRRKSKKPATLADRRPILDRLVAAISLKLEQLERRMAQDLDAATEGASATDHERETRAIGALIDNLGKVTEIASDIDRATGSKSAASAAALADEADRVRRELADRLSRIVRAAVPGA